MKLKTIVIVLGSLLLGGCQAADPLSGAKDRHDRWWDLHFTAPDYMPSWVEASAVVDINNRFFPRGGAGVIGGGNFHDEGIESARGWPGYRGNGSSVTGADLPRRVFVRWQSTVEPQTYQGWIEIPEEARQLLRKSVARRCAETPEMPSPYHASLTLGLAPGGIVKAWVFDECLNAIPVAR
ncbi:DUF2931 family protein, partial [Pseudomonas sp.]|uniref:DUF2931 family protein n=1 Tax=Pseudomonas sp. TaxID=306 RepID=UPI00262C90A7